jgi:hypothetical protein
MSRFPDYAHDVVFLGLKQLAEAGGDRGPLYDQGVLSVIRQIERRGCFDPDPIKQLAGIHHALKTQPKVVTPEEARRAEEMAKQRGWTLGEAAQYAAGVMDAEKNLAAYGDKKDSSL